MRADGEALAERSVEGPQCRPEPAKTRPAPSTRRPGLRPVAVEPATEAEEGEERRGVGGGTAEDGLEQPLHHDGGAGEENGSDPAFQRGRPTKRRSARAR